VYVIVEPIMAMLFAVASGAVLLGLMSMLSRSRD
jgi:hypothetical protein